TPALTYIDSLPEAEKTLRLAVLNARQKESSATLNHRHLGDTLEAMVEGRNVQRQQWIGRTSQHKVLNFITSGGDEPRVGQYVPVRVTATFPNSLLGEMAV
ncbi:MAG TPA: TRAM domain-containing protein, partial [Terriglobales bacterium]|nr:TRAM domain-containing protein [Terriglobales bacterium]